MENVSESRSTHDIEGIGSIRGMNGTALTTIAGAASYWEKEAKGLRKTSNRKWRDGFLTGAVSTASLTLLFITIVRFFL